MKRDKKDEDLCQVWAALLVGNKHRAVSYFSVLSPNMTVFSKINFHTYRQETCNNPIILLMADEQA